MLDEINDNLNIVVIRNDGRIVGASQAATATYGYEYNELVSMSIIDLFYNPNEISILDLVPKHNKTVYNTAKHIKKDGTIFCAKVFTETILINNDFFTALEIYTPPILKDDLNDNISEETYRLSVIKNDLKHAIENKELEILYQPQVDGKTGHVISLEALLRWNHPKLGIIFPSDFIPFAEETGLILPIGIWVLNNACSQNKTWQNKGYQPVRISINISLQQFRDIMLVDTIKRILKETNMDPNWLELEVTESVAMENEDFTIECLRSLQSMGVSIAIDDFGKGYSSLSHLRKLPANKLKIDKSFTQCINNSSSDNAIITAIIVLAKSLGLRVSAEGIENRKQLSFLLDKRCDEFQGFLFQKPVSAREIENILKNKKNFSHLLFYQKPHEALLNTQKSLNYRQNPGLLESKLEIQVVSDYDNYTYRSLINDIQDGILKISLPVSSDTYKKGYPLVLCKGDNIKIRFVKDNNMFSFDTTVEGINENCFILSYPKEIIKIQRRRHVRLPVQLDVQFSLYNCKNELPQAINAISIDIGGGGMKIYTQERIKVNSMIVMSFKIYYQNKYEFFKIKSEVVYVNEDISGGFFIGLKFLNLSTVQQDKIIGFINQKLPRQQSTHLR